MDLQHIRMLLEPFAGIVLALLVVRLDEDERGETEPDLARVEPHLVPLNDAPLFQLAQPLERGAWRHADPSRNFGVREPGVLLQQRKDSPVHFVNHAVKPTKRRTNVKETGVSK